MDDFCASFLNDRVGVAKSIAQKDPTDGQVLRLLQLATAQVELTGRLKEKRQYKYEALHRALAYKPTLLLRRCVAAITLPGTSWQARNNIARSLATLIGYFDNVDQADKEMLAPAISPFLLSLNFCSSVPVDYFLLSHDVVKGFQAILGSRFEEFYANLWQSIVTFDNWNSMIYFDGVLGISPDEAAWRESFIEFLSQWKGMAFSDPDMAEDEKYYMESVVEYLDLKNLGIVKDAFDEWDAHWAANIDTSESGDEEEDESWRATEDERWSSRGGVPSKLTAALSGQESDEATIVSMFDGILEIRSEEE